MQTLPRVSQAQKVEAPYFSVSLPKLAIMSAATLNLYDLYWMYKNWKLIKNQTGHAMMPFWRTFFAIIFVYPLFRRMRETLKEADPRAAIGELHAGPLAILWIVLTLSDQLHDPWWLICYLPFLPLLVVQSRINKLNALLAPDAPVNSKLTWANWIWIVLGSPVLITIIIGVFVTGTD